MVEFWKKNIDECSDGLLMDVKNLLNVGLKILFQLKDLIRKQLKAIKHMRFWF